MVNDDRGARLGNPVAVSLLKNIRGRNDYRGEQWRLHYLRTKEGRETDFALIRDERIRHIIECKSSDGKPDGNLLYFSSRYSLEATQLVSTLRNDHSAGTVEMRTTERFLEELFL